MNRLLQVYYVLRDNLSNLFSIVGIVLTVYLGVFYVPNYVEEVEDRKIQNAHEALMESVQELVYNNHKIDSADLATLIKGKELSREIVYPYSSEELLIQVQNRFLENKFIPLDQRKALIEKIDTVRGSLPEASSIVETASSGFSGLAKLTSTSVISIASILLGIVFALLGLVSVWVRSKVFEEAKIEATIEGRADVIRRTAHAALAIEQEMFEKFKEVLGENHVEYCPPSTPVDFLITAKSGEKIGVEVKYTETEIIPLRIINRLIEAAIELKLPIVLIANASLSSVARKKLYEFNQHNVTCSIKHINFMEVEKFEQEIQKVFS